MTTRTTEIRKRFEEDSSDAYQNIIANAPTDLEYLLARVERLEGLLMDCYPALNTWQEEDGYTPDLRDRLDAALGEE